MKNLSKLLFASLFLLLSGSVFSASNGGFSKPAPKTNDSLINSTNKSNDIVIFKMIPTPATNSGSLKKAGKVARTSNSRA
ncbi:MAG: hypothetical protein ACJ77K_01595 [Bacteroidia bacterium]